MPTIMRRVWAAVIIFAATAELCPGDANANSTAVHPVIEFQTPSDGAAIPSHAGVASVPFAATIERLEEGSVVLLNLDGQRQEDVTHVCTPPTCRIEVC